MSGLLRAERRLDLANLQLRADEDGDDYILNGQKTRTTYAQYADWIFVLCRTSSEGKKQEGITFLLADIHNTEGIEVKPFLTTGGTYAFSETWFKDARVPQANIVGPEGGGWTMAKALLGHERTGIGGIADSARGLKRAKQIAQQTQVGASTLFDDAAFRNRIARKEMRLRNIEILNLRQLAAAQLGHAPGAESSVLKIVGTELQQETDELCMDAMGHNAGGRLPEEAMPPNQQSLASQFNYNRAATIYGGSNEIQKNIIAKQMLAGRDPMNFDLTEEQQMIIDQAAKFVANVAIALPQAAGDGAGWEPTMWAKMAEQGWLAIAVPEEQGGFGGTFLGMALILEQLGRAVAEPTATGARGRHPRHQRGPAYLPQPMIGSTSLAFAHAETQSRYALNDCKTTATKDGDDYKINGEKVWVLNGRTADQIIVAARTGGQFGDEGLSSSSSGTPRAPARAGQPDGRPAERDPALHGRHRRRPAPRPRGRGAGDDRTRGRPRGRRGRMKLAARRSSSSGRSRT